MLNIIAVIGLIVLVVMIYIFSKERGDTVDILGSCEARGGTCEAKGIKVCEGGKIMPGMECRQREMFVAIELINMW